MAGARRRPARRRRRGRGDRRSAAGGRRRTGAPCAQAGARCSSAAVVARRAAGAALRAIDVVDAPTGGRSVSTAICSRVGRLESGACISTCHLGGKPRGTTALAAFVPGALPPGMIVAGAARGDVRRLPDALARRRPARAPRRRPTAASTPGRSPRRRARRRARPRSRRCGRSTRAARQGVRRLPERRHRRDIALAEREGFRVGRASQALHHARHGDRPGQDLQRHRPRDHGRADRPQRSPRPAPRRSGRPTRRSRSARSRATIAARISGRRGCTPPHAWATEQGAVFVEAGPWLRAHYFPRAGETDWLQTRRPRGARRARGRRRLRCLHARQDRHPGPDAGAFLDRVYINTFSTLPVGNARYGVMLREDGFVHGRRHDVAARGRPLLHDDHDRQRRPVMQHLEFCHQVLWPELDVQLASVTEQWAQFAVAGPRSRDVLRSVIDATFDISNAALPVSWPRARSPFGGVIARGCSASRSPASSPTRSPCRRATATRRSAP